MSFILWFWTFIVEEIWCKVQTKNQTALSELSYIGFLPCSSSVRIIINGQDSIHWCAVLTTGPGIPRSPSAPALPGGPWGPTGPVLPTGPSAPCSPWLEETKSPKKLLSVRPQIVPMLLHGTKTFGEVPASWMSEETDWHVCMNHCRLKYPLLNSGDSVKIPRDELMRLWRRQLSRKPTFEVFVLGVFFSALRLPRCSASKM